MLDLLKFVETKLLRMNCKNRAQCKEVVETFGALYEKCLADRQYCTRRLQGVPSRRETEISLLTPAAVDLSAETDKKMRRTSLPRYFGPVETVDDVKPPEEYLSQSNSKDFASFGKIHHEPETMDTEVEDRGPTLPTSNSSNVGLRTPRAQSPLKNVHFPEPAPIDGSEWTQNTAKIQDENAKHSQTMQSIGGQDNTPLSTPNTSTSTLSTLSYHTHAALHPPIDASESPPIEITEPKIALTRRKSSLGKSLKIGTCAPIIEAPNSLSNDLAHTDNLNASSSGQNLIANRNSMFSGSDPRTMPPTDTVTVPMNDSAGSKTLSEEKRENLSSDLKLKNRRDSLFRRFWCYHHVK